MDEVGANQAWRGPGCGCVGVGGPWVGGVSDHPPHSGTVPCEGETEAPAFMKIEVNCGQITRGTIFGMCLDLFILILSSGFLIWPQPHEGWEGKYSIYVRSELQKNCMYMKPLGLLILNRLVFLLLWCSSWCPRREKFLLQSRHAWPVRNNAQSLLKSMEVISDPTTWLLIAMCGFLHFFLHGRAPAHTDTHSNPYVCSTKMELKEILFF